MVAAFSPGGGGTSETISLEIMYFYEKFLNHWN